MTPKIICKYCGKENPNEAIFCMQCGSRLKGNHENHHHDTSTKPKELNIKLLLIIISITLIIAVAVLYFAGIFNSPTTQISQVNQQEQVQQVPTPQIIDLKTAQEIKSMEDFVSTNPKDYQALLQLGHKYFDTNQFEKAIAKYQIYMANNERDPDVLVDLGVCYYNLSDFANAEKNMLEAIKINPNHQIGNLNLGIVLSAANRGEEAKIFWQKAYNANPNSDFGQRAKSFLENK
jgi:tetratricopeptide (TPR) repeat protein